MKCKSCGADNPDYSVYCGTCAAELSPKATEGRTETDHEPASASTWQPGPETADRNRAEDALVAIAINVRRLFLVALLSIFITMVASLVTSTMTIMVLRDDYASSAANAMMIALSVVVTVTMIVGVVYIIARKRLTTL